MWPQISPTDNSGFQGVVRYMEEFNSEAVAAPLDPDFVAWSAGLLAESLGKGVHVPVGFLDEPLAFERTLLVAVEALGAYTDVDPVSVTIPYFGDLQRYQSVCFGVVERIRLSQDLVAAVIDLFDYHVIFT